MRTLRSLFTVFFCAWLAARGYAANYRPPAGRLPKGELWNLADSGFPGGIPDSTLKTVFTNFDNTATAAQINAAVANCPSNQVVQLTNKTFTLTASIEWENGDDGVVVRGHGTNTHLRYTGGAPGLSGLFNIVGDYTDQPEVDTFVTSITAGLTQGSTVLTVNSAAG